MMHDGNMQWCIFWANEAWNYLIFFPWSFLSWSICSWPDQIRSTQLGENLSELAFSLLCTSKYLEKTRMNEDKNAICYFSKGFAQLGPQQPYPNIFCDNLSSWNLFFNIAIKYYAQYWMIYWQTEDEMYIFNQYHPIISYFYEIFEIKIMSSTESNAIFGELDLEISSFRSFEIFLQKFFTCSLMFPF